MSGPGYLRVKKWDEFQHYKERTPPWIRLYNSLLEDYDFATLDDTEKGQLVLIWLLASRIENKIPADDEWIASKINATSPVTLSTFVRAGFLEPYDDASASLADCLHDASLEQSRAEAETHTVDADAPTTDFPARPKKDSSGNYSYPEPFERAWSAYPARDGSNPKVGAYSAFRARVARGAVPEQLVTAAQHYQKHCQAREIEGTPFVQQAATFWGPKEPWREFLEPDGANGKRPDSTAPSEIERMRRLKEETLAQRDAHA